MLFRVLPHGIIHKEFADRLCYSYHPTTRGAHPRSRLLSLLIVAVKICYASRLPFGSLRYAFAPLRSALTRKFLTAVDEESGDGDDSSTCQAYRETRA